MREECGRVLSGPGRCASGFAVVDLEATGSSSRRHRVVELAVVLLDRDLVPRGEFGTLVDPQGPVGPTHIHGIEPWHLAGAPRFAGVAARLLRLLRGRVLVGHNVGCDRAFLAAEYARLGLALPEVPQLCTMRMAAERAAAGPPPDGLSLGQCAAAIGLTGWRPHTALGDARATAALLAHHAGARPDLPERLAAAAALRWPDPSVLSAPEAVWVRRTGERAAEDAAAEVRVRAAEGYGWSGGRAGGVRGGVTGFGDEREPVCSNDSARRCIPNVRDGSA